MTGGLLSRMIALMSPRSDNYFALFNELAACTVRASLPCLADSAQAIMIITVGAAQKCVTPDSRKCRQINSGSSLRRHRWVAPAAVTPHVKHQPLQ